MLSIKDFIKKVLLGKKVLSDSYISYLRKRGAFVGERTEFFFSVTDFY